MWFIDARLRRSPAGGTGNPKGGFCGLTRCCRSTFNVVPCRFDLVSCAIPRLFRAGRKSSDNCS